MKNVKIYSTPTCPWCMRAKEYLKSKGVIFEDFNVAEDEDKRNEMMEKTGQMGVPVLDIGGNVIIGYDEHAIDDALKVKV